MMMMMTTTMLMEHNKWHFVVFSLSFNLNHLRISRISEFHRHHKFPKQLFHVKCEKCVYYLPSHHSILPPSKQQHNRIHRIHSKSSTFISWQSPQQWKIRENWFAQSWLMTFLSFGVSMNNCEKYIENQNLKSFLLLIFAQYNFFY